MFELGETAFIEHAAIYELTQTLEINCLFLGELFTEALKNTSASVFKTKKELTDYLEKKPLKNQIILLKASRGINLNTLIELF